MSIGNEFPVDNDKVDQPREQEQPEAPEPSKAPAPNETTKDEPAPAPNTSKTPFDQDPPGFKDAAPDALVRDDGALPLKDTPEPTPPREKSTIPPPKEDPTMTPEEKAEDFENTKKRFAGDEDGPRSVPQDPNSKNIIGPIEYPFTNTPDELKAKPPNAEEEEKLRKDGVHYDERGVYSRPIDKMDHTPNYFVHKDGTPMSKEEVMTYLEDEKKVSSDELSSPMK